jgi:hypothetical protein
MTMTEEAAARMVRIDVVLPRAGEGVDRGILKKGGGEEVKREKKNEEGKRRGR